MSREELIALEISCKRLGLTKREFQDCVIDAIRAKKSLSDNERKLHIEAANTAFAYEVAA